MQGSGKTRFYRKRFPERTPGLASTSWGRGGASARADRLLGARRSFVVDNTNPTPAERAAYIRAALAEGFWLVAFWLEALPRETIARNARRQGRERIPVPGVLGTYKRLQVPSLAEGFDAVFRVRSADDHWFLVEPLETKGTQLVPGGER